MHAQLDPGRYPGLCRLRPAASQRGSPKRAREQAGEVPPSDRAVRMVGHFDTLLTAPPASRRVAARQSYAGGLLTWGPDSGSALHSIIHEETRDGHA